MEQIKKCNYCGYSTTNLSEIRCPEGDMMIQVPVRVCSCGCIVFRFEHIHEDTSMEEVASFCVACGKEWEGGGE